MRLPGQRSGFPGSKKFSPNRVMNIIFLLIVFLLVLVCLLPMLNVAATSLSSELAIINRQVYFWPVDIDFEAYKSVLRDVSMMRSLRLTAILTVVSAAFSMLMTILCAYPLSQEKFVGRGLFSTMIIITMYFNPGMIPNYINIKRLGLLDNFWVMVLPVGISVFNMIILKSFFQSIPQSLRESAEIDGASHWTILTRIYLPLSKPALATLTLFYAVGRWNGFEDARLYISSRELYPIQFKLYQIINNLAAAESNMEGVAVKIAKEGMKTASIMFATIPIILVYPWLQKYFVTGVTVGDLIARGFVGAFTANYDYPIRTSPGVYNNLKKNVPGAELVPVDCFENPQGKYFKQIYPPIGIYNFVPASSKNVEAAVKYFDFLCEDEVRTYLTTGEEGVNHTKDENGIPVMINLENDDRMMNSPNNLDYAMIVNGVDLGDDEKNVLVLSKSYEAGYEDLFIQAYNIGMRDAGVFNPLIIPFEAEARYSASLKDKRWEILAKAVTAREKDFDAVYDAGIKEWLSAGGQECIDERQRWWDENH